MTNFLKHAKKKKKSHFKPFPKLISYIYITIIIYAYEGCIFFKIVFYNFSYYNDDNTVWRLIKLMLQFENLKNYKKFKIYI
jgi:hypothetical protein